MQVFLRKILVDMDIEKSCNLAEEIAKRYNPDGIAPFPFERILAVENALSISYSKKLPNNVSGVILYDAATKRYLIAINEDKPKNRQYFSVAHELGHYFLHKDALITQEIIIDDGETGSNPALYRVDEYQNSDLEKEANNFAACLLMPANLVINAWSELHDVDECAKLFEVSVVAMSIRLSRLNLVN